MLNLLDNPLGGPAPPCGEHTFCELYHGTQEPPDVDASSADRVVKTATQKLMSVLRRYAETDSMPTTLVRTCTHGKQHT